MIRKNVAGQYLYAQMNSRTDGSPLTTGVGFNYDAGTYGAGAGTLSHRGGGLWRYALTQGETNVNSFGYQFEHASGVVIGGGAFPTAADPTDAVRFGLSALPNATANAANGLMTVGTGSGQVNPTGGAVPTSDGLKPTVAGRTLDVTATGAAGIDWGNVENPTTTVNFSGTTISTSQAVASVSGSVGSVTGAVGSVTGNVGGNVTGSVASVLGNVAGSVASVTGNVGGNVTGTVGGVVGNVTGSVGSVTAAVTLPTMPTDWITAAGLSAGAVTEIQSGLSTYAGGDTAGTTTLLSRLTSTRATNLDNLDAAISSRLATSGYTSPPTAGAVADAVWDEARAGHTTAGTFGAYLDASVSGVSSGGVSAGDIALAVRTELTTELGRLDAAVSTRLATAGYTAPPSAASNATAVRTELTTELGRLDAAVSTRLATAGYTAPPTASQNATAVRTELTTELGRIDAAISSVGGGGSDAAWTGAIATASNGGTGGVGIGTFKTPVPTVSLAKHFLWHEGRDYFIASHAAGQAAFELTTPWVTGAVPATDDAVEATFVAESDMVANRAALLAAWDAGTLTMRRLDTVTAPTRGDGLAAATALAAGDKTRSGTTLTLKHLDGTTAAAKTLNDADNPTSAT